ncbi:isoprenoid biosynthesis glyoxalase ElbB [Undibacterium sp. SXout7W]|uniref:isoprenoid biosynthesis glyoxalase ElbB n=1 Tax=Undibacterium sp. SXout7W TaxID=3413049 RepID=UPI003BF1FB8A
MKVALVLSGCGVFDGTEIHEAVLTLLALVRAGAEVEFLAPDINQSRVINHVTGQVSEGETRNVLVEAARIARGKVKNIAEAVSSDYAAIFFPGGFGAATNLSDFASKGADCRIQEDVMRFAKSAADASIPACYICIAPTMIPLVYGPATRVTIGTDEDTANAITSMGGLHVPCPVNDYVIDEVRKVVSTPAYMLAQHIAEAATGIDAAVAATLALIR